MKARASGFSLIELLISMSLLATIMLLGNWSFSLFINKWEGRLGNFSANISQAKDYILLNDVINSIVPFVYLKNGRGVYYFEGNASEFSGVTLASIFNPKSAVAFRIQKQKNQDGSYYLLYQESKLEVLAEPSEINYTHEKVLIESAQNMQFSYLGWQTAIEKINSEDIELTNSSTNGPMWTQAYNSQASSLMPISIKLVWDESIAEIALVNDQGQWLSILRNAGGINE